MSSAVGPVFWERYGLTKPYSGVFYYAEALYRELDSLGIKPSIITDGKLPAEFRDANQLRVANLWPGAIASSKAFSAQYTAHAIRKLPAPPATTRLLHGLSNTNLPLTNPAKTLRFVLTVHDLIPLIAPTAVSYAQNLQTNILLPLALRKADRIIVISDWTKRELLSRFPFARSKTVLIRNGLASQKYAAPRREDGALRILTVGRSEAYKRLALIGSILRIAGEHVSAAVVTDKRGVVTLSATFPELIAAKRLHLYTQLSQADLEKLYQSTDCYVQPSLYEGHCLPAGEALSYGLPVVFVQGSAVGEVCGSTVSQGLSPSAQADEWLDAISTMSERRRATGWDEAISLHYQTLASWKDCGKAVKSLYDELLGSS